MEDPIALSTIVYNFQISLFYFLSFKSTKESIQRLAKGMALPSANIVKGTFTYYVTWLEFLKHFSPPRSLQ